MIPCFELKSQFASIESEVRAAIDDVLESGWFILGEQVRQFESEFASYIGAEHAIGVASGTEALQLALMACGVQAGDEVITVANTCVPTVAAIVCAGARPVLVDIEPTTFTMNIDMLSSAITTRTKAIVPVHLYGHPCSMDAILDVASRHGVVVVEDCAQAHGAAHLGRRCGSLGHAAAFSFYPTKNLGAYGAGGAVTTNDAEVGERLRLLRNYGERKRYEHIIQGINSRLDEMQAAVLRVKLRHLDEWNAKRRAIAAIYGTTLKNSSVVTSVTASDVTHAYHQYVVRSKCRDELQAHLLVRGVATLIHYPTPIHLQPAYAWLGYEQGSFPEAERACATVLSLPMYPELSSDAAAQVAMAITEFSP